MLFSGVRATNYLGSAGLRCGWARYRKPSDPRSATRGGFFWQREKREADLLQVLARHNPQRNVASLSRVACMATDERTDSWPGRLTDVTIDPVARLCSGLFLRFVPILSYPILFITSYDSLSVQFHMSLSLAFPHSHPCHSCPPLPIPCLCSCLFSGLGMFVESWSPTQIHPEPLSSSFAG